MGGRDGGTQIYCPNCEEIQVCRAIPPNQISDEGGQRKYYPKHPDIQFFRRGRECQECFHQFLTAEVEEDFLGELIKLRDALKDIQKNAAEYQSQAQDAANSLKRLTGSLKVLKALE